MMNTSRLQLALNVATSTPRPASTPTCSASARPSSDRVTPTSRSPTRRSSWCCSSNPDAASPLNHLGVEVARPADVVAAAERFAAAGLTHT